MRLRWRLGVLVLVGLVLLTLPAASSASLPCHYQLGFAVLHDLLPAQVSACLDDEGHNPVNGDGFQHTTGGLLVWRKADNWTAFTDGYRTWVNGPIGLLSRLNSERFSWEANPEKLSPPDSPSFIGVPLPSPSIPADTKPAIINTPGTTWWWNALLSPGTRYIGGKVFAVRSVVVPALDEQDRQILSITLNGNQKETATWSGLPIQDRQQYVATMLRAIKTRLPGQKVGVVVRMASSPLTADRSAASIVGTGVWSPGSNDVLVIP